MLIQKQLLEKLIELASDSAEYLNSKNWVTIDGNHVLLEKEKKEEKSKLPPHLQKIVDNLKAKEKNFGFTIEDVTPKGYGISEDDLKTDKTKVEKIKNETTDETIKRKIEQNLEQGTLKITEDNTGFKATITTTLGNKEIRATKKGQLYNLIMDELYGDYEITNSLS